MAIANWSDGLACAAHGLECRRFHVQRLPTQQVRETCDEASGDAGDFPAASGALGLEQHQEGRLGPGQEAWKGPHGD